jgi:hypothetical protein
MKGKILSLLAVTFFSASSFAHDANSNDILDQYRFSLFAGIGFNGLKPINTTSGDYSVSKTKGKTGFIFGISADRNLNERYTAFTGLGIDWRGGSINSSTESLPQDKYLKSALVDYKYQYLTIPIGLKMKATEIDNIKVYVQTGFDIGLLLSQKGNYYGVLASGAKAPAISNSKLKGFANSVPLNLGWSIGVGGEYELNKSNSFYALLLYRNGITDATTPQTNSDGFKFSDGNIRSNTFSLRVGYYF